jgi:hypothetical protein
MSSRIKVYFMTEDPALSEEQAINFNIRHFRNYRKNKNGGIEVDPFGGYTVLSEEGSGQMFVAKCNPRDRFNRREGLKQAIKHYMNCRIFNPSRVQFMSSFDNVSNDEFAAVYSYGIPINTINF